MIARIGVFVLLGLGAAAQAGRAQNCSVLTAGNNGFEVLIGRDTMVALEQEVVDSIAQWRNELAALRAEKRLLEQKLAVHQKASPAIEQALADARAYIAELEYQRTGFKDLAEGYKQLSSRGRLLSLEGGLGITGSNTKPAMVVGVGVSSLRLWALLQENNSGAFVGANLPVF